MIALHDWLDSDTDRPAMVIDLAEPGAATLAERTARMGATIIVGVDAAGAMPTVDAAAFDVLLTRAPAAVAPWVAGGAHEPARVTAAIDARRHAAAILCRVLRIGERLPFRDAVAIESLGYSTLLGGAAFRQWRAAMRGGSSPVDDGPPVLVERWGDAVTLTLNRPTARNATTPALRDALWEALAAVLDDPTQPGVTLRGAGRCFSVGGWPGDFGTATDLAVAHLIRTGHSPAVLLDAIGGRARTIQHGVSIGAGVEIAAAAARRDALADASFQLPELAMGLIPGAGGTASVARAIGRHRAAYLMLTGRRIGARTACDWGLIDRIIAV